MNNKTYALLVIFITSYTQLFSTKNTSNYHFRTPSQSYACKKCSHTCISSQGVRQHWERKHPSVTPEEFKRFLSTTMQPQQSNGTQLEDHIPHSERVKRIVKLKSQFITDSMVQGVFNSIPNLHLIVSSEEAQ